MTNVFEEKYIESYKSLNPEQKRAVDTIEGPVVVKAGPGTGKTQVLTLRIANILRLQGSDTAENILALTFTNAGVTAMRERLARIIGSDAYRVNIFTFHSFAEYIIKSYVDVFDSMIASSAVTDVERYVLVESIIREGDYTILKPFAAPTYHVPAILSAIDELKREYYSADDFAAWNNDLKSTITADENSYYKRAGKGFKKGDIKPDAYKTYNKNLELVELYRAYEQKLKESHKYDFNDMILSLIESMKDNPNFLYDLQERFQYLLVDEHQDTNRSQATIIDLLAGAEHLDSRPNLFTVGDDKQAIYRFQGASIENFAMFENNYKDVTLISLKQNYRSGQQVLDGAHSLIKQDESKNDHQELEAQHNTSIVSINEFDTYADELDFVAQNIKQKIESGIDAKSIAIMYRQNKHVMDIRKALSRYGVESVVLAKENILETSLVFKIILLLESINSLTNNTKLAQLLYSNIFPTETYDVIQIVERFRRGKRDKNTGEKHLFKIINEPKILKDCGVKNVDLFVSIAQELQLMSSHFQTGGFMQAFDFMMQQSGLIEQIVVDTDSHSMLRYYDRWYGELRSLEESKKHLVIQDVLDHVTVLDDYNLSLDSTASDHVNGVRLLTAHKSKGLEYKQVYITNLVDGVWGNKSTRRQFVLPEGSSRGENDDERRLLYVAITRAEQECVMTFSHASFEGRSLDGSSFLFDIDPQIATWNKMSDSVASVEKYKPVNQVFLDHSFFDDDLIKNVHARRKLSVTALNNYLDCPARYFVNNLLQIPASYTRSLMYGSIMHRSLELFFEKSKQEKSILEEEELLSFFETALGEIDLDEQESQDLLKKGRDSLSGYWKNGHETWSCLVENEMRINGVDLLIGRETVTLTGVLDKVEFVDEQTLRVIDYKTGKTYSEKSKDQKESLRRQIIFYALLLELYREGFYAMEEGVLDFVEPNKKTGEYEQFSTMVSAEDIDGLKNEISAMNSEVNQGASFLDSRCNKTDCDACTLINKIR